MYYANWISLFSLLLLVLTHFEVSAPSPSARKVIDKTFIACIEDCGKRFTECVQPVRQLWFNFGKNRRAISQHLHRCCLSKENDPNASADESFATCARVRCKAGMWGCNMKKRHMGFLSEEEKKLVLEAEKNKENQSV